MASVSGMGCPSRLSNLMSTLKNPGGVGSVGGVGGSGFGGQADRVSPNERKMTPRRTCNFDGSIFLCLPES